MYQTIKTIFIVLFLYPSYWLSGQTITRTKKFDYDWKMKPVSSADTSIVYLSGKRIELHIKHELIRGVTPDQLYWWFTNFPSMEDQTYAGIKIKVYWLWHPVDHEYVNPGKAKGFVKGNKLEICEYIGEEKAVMKAKVVSMDTTGISLQMKRGSICSWQVTTRFHQKS